MGYENDIRDFNFYQGYLWSPTDFENFEKWMRSDFQNGFLAAHGASILEGLLPSLTGGLGLQFSAGAGANPDGRILLLTAAGNVTVASPVGNPARTLIVLRPVETGGTPIPNPQNQSQNVNLHNFRSAQLVVLNGTPAANPVYPTPLSGDIVLLGLRLVAGQTNLAVTDYDLSQINVPRVQESALSEDTVSRTVTLRDEIIEANCAASGLTFTLPSAASQRGKRKTLVKVDSSVNTAKFSSTDQISGATEIEVDDQWGSVTVYSNGRTWRAI